MLLELYIYIYIYIKSLHKQREGKLAIPRKRSTDLSLSDHGYRRVRPDTPSGRLLQVERLNQEPILIEIMHSSILATTWIVRDARYQQHLEL